jgi:hypothetical protein
LHSPLCGPAFPQVAGVRRPPSNVILVLRILEASGSTVRAERLRASKWQPTAVRSAARAGHCEPSGAKLGVLTKASSATILGPNLHRRASSTGMLREMNSSVSVNAGLPLCYTPFSQVAFDRRWQSYVLSCRGRYARAERGRGRQKPPGQLHSAHSLLMSLGSLPTLTCTDSYYAHPTPVPGATCSTAQPSTNTSRLQSPSHNG